MNEKVILDIIQQIEPQLFWLLLKLFIAGIGVLLLKGFAESITAYVQFRLDKRLGVGVKVRLRGFEGKIIDYNFSWVFIKVESGIELVVMKRWRFEKWAVLNGDS